MQMDKEKELRERKDIRLKNYDYSSPGTYFVTICTENRKNYFWNGSIDPQLFDWHSVGGELCSPAKLLERLDWSADIQMVFRRGELCSPAKSTIIRYRQHSVRRIGALESNVSCGIVVFLRDYAESPTHNGRYFCRWIRATTGRPYGGTYGETVQRSDHKKGW